MKIGNLPRSMIQMNSGKKNKIKFSKQADKDKINLKSAGLDKNCKYIIDLLQDDPLCYPPPYEKLMGDLTGLYLRRINRQHRIVYEIDEEKKEVHILRMWTHYTKL